MKQRKAGKAWEKEGVREGEREGGREKRIAEACFVSIQVLFQPFYLWDLGLVTRLL